METSKASLRPDKAVHKILISTTSKFIGEYESQAMLISHAWKHATNSSGIIREEETPASRNSFVVAFRTEESDEKDIVIPDYSHIGELICSYLSVLFGKRFDSH